MAFYHEYEQREQKPIKPVVVQTGPCKENKMVGDEVVFFMNKGGLDV